MKKMYTLLLMVGILIAGNLVSFGQICDPSVPVFYVDLTGNPNGTWTSPNVSRNGLCCSASGSDGCVEFVITLDSAANGISFDIISGAVPGGALYYQVNCGPPSALGAPICLTGVGPHYITFCKPGNNNNEYQIQSIPEPSANGTQWVSQACTGAMGTQGLDESTITWTSVPYNPVYNSYLNCQAGCDSVTVTPTGVAPAYVDYQVCGTVAGACGSVSFCDTVRINFVNTLDVAITPQSPTICFGGPLATVTAQPSGGLAPFTYFWSNGATTQSITVGAGTYTVQITDAMNCSLADDTVTVYALPSPISANAGTDQLLCNGTVTAVQLSGTIVAATGGIWMNGNGTFSPDNTAMNAVYTPSVGEVTSGAANLMLVTTGNAGCPADTDYIDIGIAPQPAPVITGSNNVCQYSSQLYVASNATPLNYSWLVTGGSVTSNSGDSIVVFWTGTGTGSVTLTADNTAGCDTTIQFNVALNPQPLPVLTGAASACTPVTEVYHVTNAMNDNVSWTVSGGVISGSSTSDSVVVVWNSTGTGTVTITETNSLGCDSVISMPVALSATPAISIAGLQNICGAVQATYAASPSTAVTFNWTISGGTIVNNNGSSVDVQWTNIGSNSLTLIAANSSGCDTTIIIPVNIYPQPSPAISGASLVCTPSTSVYHISSPSGNSYSWSVTGGTISGSSSADSVMISWNAAGTGTVSVTELNSNGCDSLVSVSVNLSSTPVTSVSGLQNICGAVQSTYTASPSNAVAFSWVVNGGTIVNNNGSSVDVQWTNIGSNSLTLIAANSSGCDTTIIIPVNIYPQPSPAISGASLVCTPATSVYHVSSPSGNSYSWSVTGGTISGPSSADSVMVSWSAAGTGTVSVTELNSNGCDSLVSVPVNLSSTPITSVSGLQNICGAVQATYTASPSNAVAFSWTVNGGTIVNNNGSSVDVQWTNIGSNSLTMTATNASGCDTTIIIPVNIYPQPSPVISGASLVCTPSNAVYHISSPSGNSYSWSVTGGTISESSSADSVMVSWSAAGTGTVSVTELNSNGCDSTVSVAVNLSATPVTAVTGQQAVCGQQVMLYAATASNATSFHWTVIGGSVIQNNGDSISVSWNSTGSGNVYLTATNPDGCDTTINYPVNLYQVPAPVLSGPVTLCLPAASVYRVSSPGQNNYTWSVTEGTILGSMYADSIEVQWNNITGTGTISVTAVNAYGCDSVTTMSVALSVTPNPVITGQQAFCGPQAATYIVTASNAAQYNWTVNGGSIQNNNGDSIVVSWDSIGTTSIMMTAINAEGCDTTLYYTANIYPQPSPAITGSPAVCSPSTTTYMLSPASANTYTWTASGGTVGGSSHADSVQVQWTAAGMGSVTLTETNSYGCDTTVTTYVTLNPYPAPAIQGNNELCLQDTATYFVPHTQGATYDWSVTGGAIISFTVSNSIDVYWFNPGAGSVRLMQTSAEGCAGQDIHPVQVNPLPAPAITGPVVACLNDQVNYLSDQQTGSTYSWSAIGAAFNGSSLQPFTQVQWMAVGQGLITVTETDINGCVANTDVQVFVNPLPTASITGSQVGCVNPYGSVYQASQLQDVYYQWSVNGGSISGNNGHSQANILWNNTGISLVNLMTINTNTGCHSSTSLQVLVDSMARPQITSNGFSGCAPLGSTFGSSPAVTSYSYEWSFGDGGSSNEITTSHTYHTAGIYPVTLIASNNTGCSDTVLSYVAVYNAPVADFSLDVTDEYYLTDESSFTIQNTSAGAVEYLWSFGDGNTSTDFEPVYQYGAPGTFQVMLIATNAYGCRDSMLTSLEIKVPEEMYIPNAFTPNGDSRNDGFSITSRNITELHVTIFDRWGEEIYYSSDKDFSWDGTYFGHRVEEGVYVYVISAKGYLGKQFSKVGTVAVMK